MKCGIVNTTDKVMCPECAEKQKIYQRENRAYFRSLGLCPRCGKNKLFGDEKECPECVAMMYELNRKSREKGNFDAKEYYRKDIKMLKEKGLCRRCRNRKVADGHTYCQICLEKHREEGRKRRSMKSNDWISRSERGSYGLCYFCGVKIDSGKKICQKCTEIMVKNLPEKHSDNKSWRSDNQILFMKKRGDVSV